ncbi:MAG: RHS domain-containing protein [Deltaproteobacteria bacterium]|nr:RHS domain-containing protein [Deltaproteobacteria bacterium]
MQVRRDAGGFEVERRMPGPVVAAWRRDAWGQPLDVTLKHPGGVGLEAGFQWGSHGEFAMRIDPAEGPTRYEYDPAGALVAARHADGTVELRLTDAAGYLYRDAGFGDRRYGPGGRVEACDGEGLGWDRDGALVSRGIPGEAGWRFGWDAHGRLAEVRRPDGLAVTYGYDALGRRARKTFGGVETQYYWDGDELAHEQRGAEATTTWVFEPGCFVPLAGSQGERFVGGVPDAVGAPEALTGGEGRLVWQARIDLYGVARPQVAEVECPWRWPGQYHDAETGLHYNRFRYYDPELGRYISQDPIGLAGGLDLYAYVSDPLTQIDPYGLACYEANRSNGPNGITVGRRLSQKQALGRIRRGLDVFADTAAEARSLAKRALRGKPMRHGPHGVGYLPHYHPNQHANSSHVFFP